MLDNAMKFPVICLLSLLFVHRTDTSIQTETCGRGDIAERRYLLYDINPGEGFNLRRDVYMRIASLVKNLRKHGDWTLVLPPWGPLPHWRSQNLGQQIRLPWNKFFNVSSLRKFVPVIELEDLIMERKQFIIDHVFVLQHFRDAWTDGKWEEKLESEDCHGELRYRKLASGKFSGWFWAHNNILAHNVSCVSFQGHAHNLIRLLTAQSGHLIMIDRAEIPLHDEYGSTEYWKVRRSMRFASPLISLADEFRREHLSNTDDELDSISLPEDWRDEEATGIASKGGDYICGHLRRQDFLWGRAEEVPSMKAAASQLKNVAAKLGVRKIFIATDGTSKEMEELRSLLEPQHQLFLYQPSVDTRREILEGGVAIVEQIICSKSRYFIGSYESTFSFRIQEEREIMHFPPESTFNRFCADANKSCEQPAKWRIVY